MRTWVTRNNAAQIGYVENLGRECPCEASDALAAMGATLAIRRLDQFLHPRAWNTFNRNDTRSFQMQTPEHEYAAHFRILPEHVEPSWLRSLKLIHICTSGARCSQWVTGYQERMVQEGVPTSAMPDFVWEPSPNSCIASEWDNFVMALDCVAVVSPNHEELASLLGIPFQDSDAIDLSGLVEHIAPLTLQAHFIIRCGARGCIVVPRRSNAQSPLVSTRVEAFWKHATEVVDVTGAGNSFMGGLMVGLYQTGGDLHAAAEYGSVSASFVVQQFGPPIFSEVDGEEKWNGDTAARRLKETIKRRL
ncbi:Ribokinase-like protein [Chytriomyces sp. MP71]|nr:Ribokinase-like protein [Chytriomyces sp. MP71]